MLVIALNLVIFYDKNRPKPTEIASPAMITITLGLAALLGPILLIGTIKNLYIKFKD